MTAPIVSRRSRSPEETERLAEQLGERLASGDVLALIGELGAGKTCFVRGLARGLGVTDEAAVASPSFVFIREYFGRLPLAHIDLFRVRSEGDLRDVGLEEYVGGEGVAVVEWAERGLLHLPAARFIVTFWVLSGGERALTLSAAGAGPQERLVRWAAEGLWADPAK